MELSFYKQINLGIVTSPENMTISGEPGIRPISNFVENSVVISVNSRNSQPDYVAAKALRLTTEDLKNNIIMNEIIKMVDYEYRVIYYKSAVDLFKYFDTSFS